MTARAGRRLRSLIRASLIIAPAPAAVAVRRDHQQTVTMTVQVYYSDQPGQDPTWEPRGGCPDWTSAVALVEHHLGSDVRPRAVSSNDQPVVIRVYSSGGDSSRLEGPPPGPQH